MIRQLQKRFIRIAVLTLTLAMVLVVGIVNLANLVTVRSELSDTLELLAGTDAPPERQSEDPAFRGQERTGSSSRESGTPLSGRFGDRSRHTRNMISESNWFSAVFSAEGEIVFLNTDSIGDTDEETARRVAEQAFESGNEKGSVGDYLYLVRKGSGPDTRVVVLNCETRLSSVRTLALISGLACLGGILLALLLVSLGSRKAVEPTIRNMEQQKRFITDASHELKTPLTVISANMELLNTEYPDNQWIRSTRKQASAMKRLVDELVYLSRMEEEHPALSMERTDLGALLEETAEPFAAMAEFNGREMAVRADPGLFVSGDRASLQRLISTLCDNAAKYAPEGGTISAEAFPEGRNAVLKVSNTVEEPLTREQCARLFDRFYRADPSRNKEKQTGFGIGLAIAAAIAEKHGGSIRAAMEQDRLVITCSLPRQTGS